MDLVQYINQLGKDFWSERLDFDQRRHHGVYGYLTKVEIGMETRQVLRFYNRELNEDVPYKED